jgi:hypothetical protein
MQRREAAAAMVIPSRGDDVLFALVPDRSDSAWNVLAKRRSVAVNNARRGVLTEFDA